MQMTFPHTDCYESFLVNLQVFLEQSKSHGTTLGLRRLRGNRSRYIIHGKSSSFVRQAMSSSNSTRFVEFGCRCWLSVPACGPAAATCRATAIAKNIEIIILISSLKLNRIILRDSIVFEFVLCVYLMRIEGSTSPLITELTMLKCLCD